jgi:predicted membrane-bound spermidine synthase
VRVRRAVAIALALPTGCAGLVYEVVWQQSLALLLGSDAAAAASVLALVLGGIAVGYAAFGRLARGLAPRDGLYATAAVELGLGLHALAFPALVESARTLRGVASDTLPAVANASFAFDLGIAALLIAPPSLLLGGSLPLLTQALARRPDATRVHAALYAANTFGGGAGALAAGLVLVPAFGLAGALRIAAALSLGAGVLYAWLAGGERAQAVPPPTPARAHDASPARLLWASACVGFGALALQSAALRLSVLAFGAAPYAFACVVAAFVLGIGAGSLAVSLLPRVPRSLLPVVVAWLALWTAALYLPLGDAPYYAHRLRVLFPSLSEAYPAFQLAVLLALLGVLGPPAALSGAALPLLFQRVQAGGDAAGGAAGRLYAWNTLGAVAGALLGGHALLAWLDLHQLMRVAAGALACAAALCAAGPSRAGRLRVAAALAAAWAVLALLPAWSPQRLSAGAFRLREAVPETRGGGASAFFARWRHTRMVSYDDDPTASIAVMDEPLADGTSDRSLVSNGKSDGAVRRDRTTMGLAALLAALFAQRSERFFVIGYGTGVTAGELAALPGDPEVVVAEISPAVVAAAPLFDAWNGGATRRGNLRIVQADAYRALASDAEGFDAIVSEPSNPWVAGVEMLFAREFLAAGRERLRPGGVYVQWLHSYESDSEVLALALRTFRDVFPDASLWYGLGPDLLLLGTTSPDALRDLERFLRRAESPALHAGLVRAGIDGVPELLAHELWPSGVLRALPLAGPLHTLWHPRLRHAAARAFFVGRPAHLPLSALPDAERAGRSASLTLRYAARHGGWSPEARTRYTRELCRQRPAECFAALAAWRAEGGDGDARGALESDVLARLSRAGPRAEELARLSRLFPGRAMLPNGGDPLDEAREATRLYAERYHHGAPFAREALAALWRECPQRAPARAAACDAARRDAEALVGPLDGRAGAAGEAR